MRAKTHFEQIPVDKVMNIAKKFPERDVAGNNGVSVEPTDQGLQPHEESWREVAQQIQKEQDPKTMSLLVQKLITELDEVKLRKRGIIGGSGPAC